MLKYPRSAKRASVPAIFAEYFLSMHSVILAQMHNRPLFSYWTALLDTQVVPVKQSSMPPRETHPFFLFLLK